MASKTFICRTTELADPGSRGFCISHHGARVEGFVVGNDGQYYAYLNSCPHTGSPLDWVEHQFLDGDKRFIQCATHDARFAIDTGVCVAGPCAGGSLKPLTLRREGNELYLV